MREWQRRATWTSTFNWEDGFISVRPNLDLPRHTFDEVFGEAVVWTSVAGTWSVCLFSVSDTHMCSRHRFHHRSQLDCTGTTPGLGSLHLVANISLPVCPWDLNTRRANRPVRRASASFVDDVLRSRQILLHITALFSLRTSNWNPWPMTRSASDTNTCWAGFGSW